MKIAVCVDKSDVSKHAVEEAVSFCGMIDAEMVLLHSVQENIYDSSDVLVREGNSQAMDDGNDTLERMEEFVKQRNPDVDVQTELICGEGEPVNDIQSYLESNDIDHVFLGHRALDKRKENLFGSFAKDMIGNSEVPVTIVSD